MQMLCKVSNTFSDLRCPVCGQGFMVYWTRMQRREQVVEWEEMAELLQRHHTSDLSHGAHPTAFEVEGASPFCASRNPIALTGMLGVYS